MKNLLILISFLTSLLGANAQVAFGNMSAGQTSSAVTANFTNANAVMGNFTNVNAPNITVISNLAASATSTAQAAYLIATTAPQLPSAQLPINSPIEELGNTTTGTQSGFYGVGDAQLVKITMYLTNISMYLNGNGSNITAWLKVFVISSPTNCSISWTNTAITTQMVGLAAGGNGYHYATNKMASINIPNAPLITAGQWLAVCAIETNYSQSAIQMNDWYNDSGNTNQPRQAWLFSQTGTNFSGGSPAYNANSCAGVDLYGYTMSPLMSTASQLPYSPAASGLNAVTVQSALDSLATNPPAAPWLPSKTVVVLDGDSKMLGLGAVLTNYPWWNSVSYLTNTAVGGTSLSFTTNQWGTNNVFLSSKLKNGTNGLYVLWTMHNDYLSVNPYTEIAMLSNYVNWLTASNWNVMILTPQPRASYATDVPSSWLFVPVVNNWIRTCNQTWRVVDSERLVQNCYDPSLYIDTTHLTGLGYSNICQAVESELFRPVRSQWPQEWSYLYGTNFVTVSPGTNGQNAVIISYANGAGTTFANGWSGLPVATNLPSNGFALRYTNGSFYWAQ